MTTYNTPFGAEHIRTSTAGASPAPAGRPRAESTTPPSAPVTAPAARAHQPAPASVTAAAARRRASSCVAVYRADSRCRVSLRAPACAGEPPAQKVHRALPQRASLHHCTCPASVQGRLKRRRGPIIQLLCYEAGGDTLPLPARPA
jgi:hypothetical protein